MANMLQDLSNEMADLVESAAESTVRVEARRRLPATGIVWSENLIVTAHHVVERDDDISIGLPDGGRVSAALVGRDPRHDLALLRADAALRPPNWAREDDLRVGNLVLALGRPKQRVNATLGVVMGVGNPSDVKRRRQRMKKRFEKRMKGGMKEWQGQWKGKRRRQRMFWERGGMSFALGGGFIHSDVTMYPGFSGGPLLDAGGFRGMNTSGFAGGMAVAAPRSVIAESVAALLEHGKIPSGYLGVGVQTAQLPSAIAETLDQELGLLIVSIEADSPAASAGLLVGDMLTALDEDAIEDVDELQALLARAVIGSAVKTQFVRGGELREGSVTVGSR